jgi:hypothetical protein
MGVPGGSVNSPTQKVWAATIQRVCGHVWLLMTTVH